MQLLYNDILNRYEFYCQKNERDPHNRLGFALASNARFKPQWNGPNPFWVTQDHYKALQLAVYATEPVREQIKQAIAQTGGSVPVLSFKNGVYIWSGPPTNGTIDYQAIPKRAGFVYTRTPSHDLPHQAGSGMDEPVWWTEQSGKAKQCHEYADELARVAIDEQMERRRQHLEASRAEDSDIEIPVPPGLTPYGYQKAGVAYFLPRKRILLGDEMGLGKTIQAALWINKVSEIKSVLVVCPASLKRNWRRELERWLVRPVTIGIADTRYNTVVPSSNVVIINYDILSKKHDTGKTRMKQGKIVKSFEYRLRDALRKKWDLLVVDECHRVKGDPKTVIRSRMVLAIEAERMLFMTGTPLVNKPRELWNLVHHLAPKAFPSKLDFMRRYCKGGNPKLDPYGGARNLGELQEKLRMWIMVRRLKKDVLKDLPPKLRQVIELPAEGCEAVLKSEMLAFQRKEDIFTTLRLRVELAKASENPDEYKRAVAGLKEGIKVSFEELSIIRRDTAIAKIPVVTEHVASILSEGHKVILFAHHKEVVRKVAAEFKGEVVVYTGDTSLKERDLAVQAFQNKDNIRLFIGTIGAAGVGLTLTASSYVVFAELDWVPGNVTQAEDRAHRIGQAENVLIQHLVLEGSLDKRMADVLVEKQDIADRALDRDTTLDLLDDPITPERESVATQGVTQKDIAKLAEQLTAEHIAAVHFGLRLLAGTHEDAGLLDGLTFRDVDAALGRTLASKKTLTPRLAALGKKFLARYLDTQLGVVPEIQQLFEVKK